MECLHFIIKLIYSIWDAHLIDSMKQALNLNNKTLMSTQTLIIIHFSIITLFSLFIKIPRLILSFCSIICSVFSVCSVCSAQRIKVYLKFNIFNICCFILFPKYVFAMTSITFCNHEFDQFIYTTNKQRNKKIIGKNTQAHLLPWWIMF